MEKISEYFIGIDVPPQQGEKLAKIKQNYHPQHRLSSPPHLTIVPPFKSKDETQLIDRIIQLIKRQKSFKLAMKKIDVFANNPEAVVILTPINKSKITDLAVRFLKSFKMRSDRFTPHLTLVQEAPKNRVEEIKKEMEAGKLGFEFTVKSVVLFKRFPGEGWSIFKTIPFGGQH